MEYNKDFSKVVRYLTLLQESIKKKEKDPSNVNTEMCKKYYKLYSDEYIQVFNCEPDLTNLQDSMKTIQENIDFYNKR